MNRIFPIAALFATLLLSGGDWMRPVVSLETAQAYAKACNHYENRARFKPRDRDVEFVTLLAEACGSARASLSTGGHDERVAADRFLARLVVLFDTVIEMNMARVYGADASPFAKPILASGTASDRMKGFGSVSEAGELLIAKRLGLLTAYDDWMSTGARFKLAKAWAERL